MLGIIVQLLISWAIIWLFEKGNLNIFGFYPTQKRLLGFVLFFIVTALCCSSDFFMRMLFAQQQWELNPKLTANLVLTGTWWNVKSVLFEEFIFRGVLFYILIKKLGHTKAIIISATCFGIYHCIGSLRRVLATLYKWLLHLLLPVPWDWCMPTAIQKPFHCIIQ